MEKDKDLNEAEIAAVAKEITTVRKSGVSVKLALRKVPRITKMAGSRAIASSSLAAIETLLTNAVEMLGLPGNAERDIAVLWLGLDPSTKGEDADAREEAAWERFQEHRPRGSRGYLTTKYWSDQIRTPLARIMVEHYASWNGLLEEEGSPENETEDAAEASEPPPSTPSQASAPEAEVEVPPAVASNNGRPPVAATDARRDHQPNPQPDEQPEPQAPDRAALNHRPRQTTPDSKWPSLWVWAGIGGFLSLVIAGVVLL